MFKKIMVVVMVIALPLAAFAEGKFAKDERPQLVIELQDGSLRSFPYSKNLTIRYVDIPGKRTKRLEITDGVKVWGYPLNSIKKMLRAEPEHPDAVDIADNPADNQGVEVGSMAGIAELVAEYGENIRFYSLQGLVVPYGDLKEGNIYVAVAGNRRFKILIK